MLRTRQPVPIMLKFWTIHCISPIGSLPQCIPPPHGYKPLTHSQSPVPESGPTSVGGWLDRNFAHDRAKCILTASENSVSNWFEEGMSCRNADFVLGGGAWLVAVTSRVWKLRGGVWDGVEIHQII
jgi:hypothetical protein